jgi:hypothetical protein
MYAIQERHRLIVTISCSQKGFTMKKFLVGVILLFFASFNAYAQPLDYTKPIVGTVIGYELLKDMPRFPASQTNPPLFGLYDQDHPQNTYDRSSPEWWDNLVEELQFSRVHVGLMLARGCALSEAELMAAGGYANPRVDEGHGNACPRTLRKLTDALVRNAVPEGGLRFAFFDDTLAYKAANGDQRLDITNLSHTMDLMWDRNIMVFFDTVPSKYWYRDENGHPLLVMWSPEFFTPIDPAHTNEVNAVFNRIRQLFNSRYGVYPSIYLHRAWVDWVPGIDRGVVQGAYGWISPDWVTTPGKPSAPGKPYGFADWNGAKMGTVSPGFRNQNSNRGCGEPCREVSRDHGNMFAEGMSNAYGLVDGRTAKFVILEGFTNVPESAGYYRSTGPDYDFPNQYLNRVRDWADPNPREITFQAEASDYRQGNNTPGNQGGSYSDDDLDVGKLAGPGYYVGWITQGEKIGFKRVKLPAKPFEIRVRTATPLDRRAVKVTFERQPDGQTDASADTGTPTTVYGPWTMPLPNTGSLTEFKDTQIAVFRPAAGYYNIKIDMATDGFNIDWLQIREASPDCSNEYPGIENVVGLNQGTGDPRFVCKNRQWYSCGWNATAPWTTNAQAGPVVGDFQCNPAAPEWTPLVNSCSGGGYSGLDNVVGLNNGNGDSRFLCKNRRWYACNWGTNATWATGAQLGQPVGTYMCDGAAWVPR